MNLSRSLRLQPHEIIALVGAGGKTTTLFRLADELVTQDKRVVVTTTTRLGANQVGTYPATMLRFAQADNDFSARVRAALKTNSQVLIVGDHLPGNKVAGVPPELIDQLAALENLDAIIYEADGARALPFKAPAPHEPVIAQATTLLVPVIGVSALGAPLDDAHAHRAEIIARLAGAQIGETITPLIAARVVAHADGGLKNKPDAARVIAFVNQVETESQLNAARALAHLLLGYNTIAAVSIGAAQAQNPICETHRRIAAVVFAAGAGTRMQGRIKQLLPWRGKTLVENAIAIATQSKVNETLVVLGAHAADIRAVVRQTGARVVLNREWADGHAASIRAGLNALPPGIDAAIFINADQPWLTSQVIDALIQRCRETDAPIIAPYYAGKRGSPVLFNRKYFFELARLQGEQGGRALLANYPVERIDFADASFGVDVDTLEEYNKLT